MRVMIKEKYGYDQFTLQMPYGNCERYICVNAFANFWSNAFTPNVGKKKRYPPINSMNLGEYSSYLPGKQHMYQVSHSYL